MDFTEEKRSEENKYRGVYREHCLLLQTDEISASEAAQNSRWEKITNNWCKAGNMTQCHLIGDLNLDFLKWATPDHGQITMTEMVKDKIVTQGFSQLVHGPTRFWPNCEDSLIDQAWSNTPEQIISVSNVVNSVADHNVIEMIIRLKGRISTPKEVISRIITNLNFERYKLKISNIDWTLLYAMTDINLTYN